jgi:hypothetical protein
MEKQIIHCKYCGCEVLPRKPVAVGSWLDAEKIYLCDEHLLWLNDETEVEMVDSFYREDESWRGSVLPVKSIKVPRRALIQVYIALRGWLLVEPKYPRKTPIQNIMIYASERLPNDCLMDLNLALLFIHWVTVEDERHIDFEEFDFFNPCTAEIFDTMSMQSYQDCFSKYIHNVLRVS